MIKTKKIERYALGLLFPALIIDIFFSPLFGFLLPIAMIIAISMSIANGRTWCADSCPRGLFFDEYLSRVSLNRPIPVFFKSLTLKIIWVVLLFYILISRMIQSHGDLFLIGKAFAMILIMTTIIAIPLGLFYNSRILCTFCPMGSICTFIGKNKGIIKIEKGKCSDCKSCLEGCPMEIDAGSYKESGTIKSLDCIKCKKCIENCPSKAIK